VVSECERRECHMRWCEVNLGKKEKERRGSEKLSGGGCIFVRVNV